jgi:hypothetical protein
MRNPYAGNLHKLGHGIKPNKKYEPTADEFVKDYLEPPTRKRFDNRVQSKKAAKRRNRYAKEERDYS